MDTVNTDALHAELVRLVNYMTSHAEEVPAPLRGLAQTLHERHHDRNPTSWMGPLSSLLNESHDIRHELTPALYAHLWNAAQAIHELELQRGRPIT